MNFIRSQIKPKRRWITIYVLTVFSTTTLIQAGIPERGIVLYGTITVNGRIRTVSDNIVVVARIEGSPETIIGSCHLGDNPRAGDHYVLRIRAESLADGSTVSKGAALKGENVKLFVKMGNGPENYVATVNFKKQGALTQLDLNIADVVAGPYDFEPNGKINMKDFAYFSKEYGRTDCVADNNYCNKADFDHSGAVDLIDLENLAAVWLQGTSPL